MAKNRIEELKLQEGEKQLENMVLKQEQDRLEIEEAHTKEYEKFQLEWDENFKNKEEEHSQMIGQLEEFHTKELEENRV